MGISYLGGKSNSHNDENNFDFSAVRRGSRRPARAAEPLDLFGGIFGGNRFGGRPNQGLKNHGRTKFWTGAGLWGLGALTNNQGLQNVGGGLAKLGLASKVLAHVPGFRGK